MTENETPTGDELESRPLLPRRGQPRSGARGVTQRPALPAKAGNLVGAGKAVVGRCSAAGIMKPMPARNGGRA